MKKILPILLVAISAALWGIIAIFVRGLDAFGFTSMEIVTIRVVTAAVLLGITGLVKYPAQMKIKWKDAWLFVGTGVCSIVLFNWCYFSSIQQMNLSLAVILLYTAPAFVTVLSWLILKEKLNAAKLVSVAGTILGCVLVAGSNLNETTSISAAGLLTGLGAGFGYALYTIFGKFALNKYTPFTVTLYTFIVASIALVPVTGLWNKGSILFSGEVIFYGLGLGLFPTVVAYLLYTKGLEKIDSSKASIIATVEPVVATLLGVFLYKEGFAFIQFIGSFFILLSVLLVNLPKNPLVKTQNEKASIT
ncbi:EamA family transporter [Neobacillus cucumis]|uniref:DMT family transporter n=1 Tax=Neobacillus cucumis TaxID=1740721 RepID=UPI0018E0541C|nr:EamA family transporter [Neobacillus cucumis]MBI0576077.1 EamA family transporter [Neobacillus cucumis]